MFKKDSLVTGIIIGAVVTVGGYFAIYYLNIWISDYFFNKAPVFGKSSVEVFAIFLNVFPFRYFMLKTDKELIGRGILMVTFIVGLSYFFYYLQ
ncbi:MAG: hypothetical protein IPP71_17270 [Bacteroidetes bacterium]|nr:hypothetical protein [Bacteroidota bacterium]